MAFVPVRSEVVGVIADVSLGAHGALKIETVFGGLGGLGWSFAGIFQTVVLCSAFLMESDGHDRFESEFIGELCAVLLNHT